MAIFGRRHFSPKVLPSAGSSREAWQRAADELEYTRNGVGGLLDKFERFIAEQARRQHGAPPRASQARALLPLTELIPAYELVPCDVCHAHTPLALSREVIQWQDTRLARPARVWYACSLSCSQFLQRTLSARPGAESHEMYDPQQDELGQRSRSTIPLIDRGRTR